MKWLEKPLKDVPTKMSNPPGVWGTCAWICQSAGRHTEYFEDRAVSSLQLPRKPPARTAKPPSSWQSCCDTGTIRGAPSNPLTRLVCLSVQQDRWIAEPGVASKKNVFLKSFVSGAKHMPVTPAFEKLREEDHISRANLVTK